MKPAFEEITSAVEMSFSFFSFCFKYLFFEKKKVQVFSKEIQRNVKMGKIYTHRERKRERLNVP